MMLLNGRDFGDIVLVRLLREYGPFADKPNLPVGLYTAEITNKQNFGVSAGVTIKKDGHKYQPANEDFEEVETNLFEIHTAQDKSLPAIFTLPYSDGITKRVEVDILHGRVKYADQTKKLSFFEDHPEFEVGVNRYKWLGYSETLRKPQVQRMEAILNVS